MRQVENPLRGTRSALPFFRLVRPGVRWKPWTVVVALQLASSGQALSYGALAQALEMSPSQTHSAVARAVRAGLVQRDSRRVNRRAPLEFLVHGVKYVFPAVRGRTTRGIPTAHAAPPLAKQIVAAGELARCTARSSTHWER